MKQQPQEPLFDATHKYLTDIQTFLQQHKGNFPDNFTGDQEYDQIIGDANNKVIQKIDDAIKIISSLREKLETITKKKEQRALKNQPRR